MTAQTPAATRLLGLTLAAAQFCFALSWVIYVIYLPALAEQAGLPRHAVVWILLLDQLIFVLSDLAAGAASDRVAWLLGRIGPAVLGVTLVSCLAFVALPWLAPQGSPELLLLFIVLWALSSSALRAPPLALIGRHAARPARPALIGLTLLGLGLANAAAPYLALQLRTVDPRVPFVLASLALALATAGLVVAERRLPSPAAPDAHPPQGGGTGGGTVVAFLAAALLAAAAFQVHTFLNSAPLYLRHAPAQQLPALAPLFWVGFNLALWPSSLCTRRFGAWRVMAVAGVLAALAAALAHAAPGLVLLCVAQVLAGAGWAALLGAAFAAALTLGEGGREGRFSARVSALLALAALARMATVSAGAASLPQVLLSGWPTLAWLAAAALLAPRILQRTAKQE